MKIHVLSDLHLEFGDFDLPRVDADVLVFPGDRHTKLNGIKWIKENALKTNQQELDTTSLLTKTTAWERLNEYL